MQTAEELYPYLPNTNDDIAIKEWNQRIYDKRDAHNKAISLIVPPSPVVSEGVETPDWIQKQVEVIKQATAKVLASGPEGCKQFLIDAGILPLIEAATPSKDISTEEAAKEYVSRDQYDALLLIARELYNAVESGKPYSDAMHSMAKLISGLPSK